MKKNFLYELKKLSPKEWRQFLAYIPVVTKSTLILSLLGFVKKAPDMESMEKKAIFQKVYGNKPYSDVLMRQLIFRVQQIYEQFLISQKSIHNEKDYLLLASTPQKKYHRKKIIDKIETQIQNEQYSIQFYRNKLYIAIEEQETIGESQIRTHEPNYQAVNDHFDRLFLIEKLKITCGALSFANINQYEYDFSFIESLEPYCNENITEEEGILYALYKTYLIHKYHDQDSFFLLLEFLSKNKLYKNEETDLILRMAGNFSIKEINKGHLKYFEHLYNIYDITIKNNCLKNENNEIEFNTYLNIITTAFRIQKFQWAHQFLDNHIQYLPAQSEDSNKLYLYARLYFEQKNYHKALQNLSMANRSSCRKKPPTIKMFIRNG